MLHSNYDSRGGNASGVLHFKCHQLELSKSIMDHKRLLKMHIIHQSKRIIESR